MNRILVTVLLSCVLMFRGGPAVSGPIEDYEAGRKAFQEGDVAGAVVILKKPADQNHVPSQILLGRVLDGAGEDELAVDYFRKAAGQGDAEAEFELGGMYVKGEGVKQDLKEARVWVRRAAERGLPAAVAAMADAYMGGGLGLTDAERSDRAESGRWIKSAADKGHGSALIFLADRYLKQSATGDPDPEALDWVKRAAEKDYLPAVEALAEAYRRGGPWGVTADTAEAKKWDAKAKTLKGKGKKRKT